MSDTPLTSVLPLSRDVLKELVFNPNIKLIIDYDNSETKGRAALVYITNFSIKDITINCTNKKEAFDLIDTYITHKSTINIPILVNSLIMLYTLINEIELPDGDRLSIGNNTFIHDFDDVEEYFSDTNRIQNLVNLGILLDNIPTFIYSCSKAIYEKQIPVEQTVDNIDFTGTTFVNLLKNEIFVSNYYSKTRSVKPIFFKQQFREHIYSGKNLFSELLNEFIMTSVFMIDAGKITTEQLEQIASVEIPEEV